MMNGLIIIVYIWLAFIATSFWESSVEGRRAWDKGKVGWKLKFGKYVISTRYHFWVYVMFILLLGLPFLIFGWNKWLFGIILTAFFSGWVVEDFFWYLVNPVVKVRELNTKFASYYPRINFGYFKIPLFYFIGIILAVVSYIIFCS